MSKYEGKNAVADISITEAYDKLSDLKALQQRIDSLPEEHRSKLQGISFGDDSVAFNTPVGDFRFTAAEKVRPERIVFAADGSPIPVSFAIYLNKISDSSTGINTVIDADLPFFVKSMVGGKLKDAVEKINAVIARSLSNNS